MAYSEELANRIREALSSEPSVREVRMFGGLSFMVNEKLAVAARGDGDLLVRCDPGEADDFIAGHGAQWAETTSGRLMSKGWLAIHPDRIVAEEDFRSWIRVALDYRARETGHPGTREPLSPGSAVRPGRGVLARSGVLAGVSAETSPTCRRAIDLTGTDHLGLLWTEPEGSCGSPGNG